MTARHTPGPWKPYDHAGSGCRAISAPAKGKGYYSLIGNATQRDAHPNKGGGITWKEAEANATMMAVAPELVESAEALLLYLRSINDHGHYPKNIEHLCKPLDAACKKARGE